MLSTFLKEDEKVDAQAEQFAKRMMARSQMSLRASRVNTGKGGGLSGESLKSGSQTDLKKQKQSVRKDAWDAEEDESPKEKKRAGKKTRFAI